jgi:hypothetical protein
MSFSLKNIREKYAKFAYVFVTPIDLVNQTNDGAVGNAVTEVGIAQITFKQYVFTDRITRTNLQGYIKSVIIIVGRKPNTL